MCRCFDVRRCLGNKRRGDPPHCQGRVCAKQHGPRHTHPDPSGSQTSARLPLHTQHNTHSTHTHTHPHTHTHTHTHTNTHTHTDTQTHTHKDTQKSSHHSCPHLVPHN